MSRRIVYLLLAAGLLFTSERRVASRPAHPGSAPARAVQGAGADSDPLPPAAVARLGALRLFHGGAVTALAFLRDGKTLLSTGEGPLRAWDVATGKEVPLPVSLPGDACTFALSPNGRLLAVIGGDWTLRIHDLQTRSLLRQQPLDEGHANVVAFSPDSRVVAWVDSTSRIHLHDLAVDRETRLLTGHLDAVLHLTFAPDGKTLASTAQADGVLHWDLATGKRRRRYGDQHGPFPLAAAAGVCFGLDSQSLLAATQEGVLSRYDMDSIDEQRRIGTGDGLITSMALSADGKILAAGGMEGGVRLWDPVTGKALKVFPAAAPPVPAGALAFTADGKTLAVGGENGTIRLWDVAAARERLPRKAVEPFAAAGFSPDGREVIALQTTRLTRWSAGTGKVLREVHLPGGNVTAAALSPDGKLVAVAREDKQVCVLETQQGVERAQTPAVFRKDAALVFTPDSRQLVGVGVEEINCVHVWSAQTGKSLFTMKSEAANPFPIALALSRDGRTLFTGGQEDGVLLRWEMLSGQRRGRFRLPGNQQTNKGEGTRAMRLARGLAAGGAVLVADEETPGKWLVALSPDGRSLAVARGELIFLCDSRSDRVLSCFTGATQPLSTITFSPDGRLLAAGGEDRLVRLWDVRTGAARATLSGHRGSVLQLAFSATSNRLLSSSADGTCLVWDVAAALRLAPAAATAALQSSRSLEALWADLGSENAAVAERAQRELEARPALVLPFLARQVRPVPAVPPARLAQLVADLDSSSSAVRDRASEQLDRLGELAVPALSRAAGSPSAEVRKRAERLLERHGRAIVMGASARPVRVVELLEQLGTGEARKLLIELAGGAADARLTREALAAVERLRGR